MQVRVEEGSSREFVMLLDGELDMATEPLLTDAVSELLAGNDASSLTIDLSGLLFLDSSGMRALLRAQAVAEERGVKLSVCKPREHIAHVLRIAALDHLLGIDGQSGPARAGGTPG